MGSADELVRSFRRREPAHRRNEQAAIPARFAWPILVVSTICRTALCTALALMLWSILPNFAGFHSSVVMSGSMSPRLQVGDAVVTRSITSGQLSVGQVLLFDDPDHHGQLRLHRLVSVRDDGLVTKGDANAQEDSSMVAFSAVRGAGFLRIPFAGLPELWVRTGQATPLIASGVLALVLFAGVRLDRLLEDPEARGRRRHRGVRAPGLHRATASVLAVIVLAGSGMAAQTSSAHATYRGSTSTAAAWRTCNDLKRGPMTPAPRFYWGYGYGPSASTVVPDSSSSAFPSTVGADAGLISGVTSGWSRQTCSGSNGPYLAVGANAKPTVVAEQTLGAFPTVSTVATWFRTSTKAGVLADFSGSKDLTTSSSVDRLLYMNSSGQLVFANAYIGLGNVRLAYTCTTPASYATNTWYNVVATWSYDGGCTIAINGTQVVSSKPLVTLAVGSSFSGAWRFGYEDISSSGLAGLGSQSYFTGDLDESQVYDSLVSAATIYARGH